MKNKHVFGAGLIFLVIAGIESLSVDNNTPSKIKTDLTPRQKAAIVLDCAANPDAWRCK